MLYSLGQHGALQEVQDSLMLDEYLFAYLDDIYVVYPPERVSAIYKFFGSGPQRERENPNASGQDASLEQAATCPQGVIPCRLQLKDQRRIAQLAVDTTLVSPLRADGEPHGRSVLIQSWSVTVNVCLLHTRLSVSSPGRRPAPYQSRCALVLANLGCSDGGLFWLVPLPGRLRLRC